MIISTIFKTLQKYKIYDDIKPLLEEIAPLLHPLPKVTEDVTYHDSFLNIKSEFEKVSDIQWEKIEEEGKYLCQNVGKDIRVAIYLTYAYFRKDAYQGLIKGLLLLYGMQILFADIYQPRRTPLIKNLLQWLSGDKMENAVLLCHSHLLESEYQSIKKLCELIEYTFNTQLHHEFNELTSLLSLLSVDSIQNLTINPKEIIKKDENLTPPISSSNLSTETVLRSSQDLMGTMKAIGQFIQTQEKNQWAAFRLLRQFRWDLLTRLPIHQNGITKIIAPRQELMNRLESLYSKKDWQGLLEQCHAAFLEASNHFCFDLQYLSWTAMQHLPDEGGWADILSSDLAFLLARLPGLENLSFSNNRVFASEETLQWINVYARFNQQNLEQPYVIVGDKISSDETIEEEAFTILKEQNLDKALNWLNTVRFEDCLEQEYRKQFLMARLAIQDEKVDFAISLLEKINIPFSHEPLFSWNKKLTFQVKNELLKLLLKKQTSNKVLNKAIIYEQVEVLMKDLVLLDPCLAHQLLYK